MVPTPTYALGPLPTHTSLVQCVLPPLSESPQSREFQMLSIRAQSPIVSHRV